MNYFWSRLFWHENSKNFCLLKILGGFYPYEQVQPSGPVKKDAKKLEQPTRFALVEVEVIHMETGEKMCVLGKAWSTDFSLMMNK